MHILSGNGQGSANIDNGAQQSSVTTAQTVLDVIVKKSVLSENMAALSVQLHRKSMTLDYQMLMSNLEFTLDRAFGGRDQLELRYRNKEQLQYT